MRRLSLVLLLALTLAPTLIRLLPGSLARRCREEGRGKAPRTWLGCATDGGPPRGLDGDERLLLGLPLDLESATARELAFVPGISSLLAAEIVADRAERGRYWTVEELLRVRGIGPRRLERARPWLTVSPPRVVVAPDAQ